MNMHQETSASPHGSGQQQAVCKGREDGGAPGRQQESRRALPVSMCCSSCVRAPPSMKARRLPASMPDPDCLSLTCLISLRMAACSSHPWPGDASMQGRPTGCPQTTRLLSKAHGSKNPGPPANGEEKAGRMPAHLQHQTRGGCPGYKRPAAGSWCGCPGHDAQGRVPPTVHLHRNIVNQPINVLPARV